MKTEKNEKKFKKSDSSVIAVELIATSPVGAFRNDDG